MITDKPLTSKCLKEWTVIAIDISTHHHTWGLGGAGGHGCPAGKVQAKSAGYSTL